MPKVLNSQRKLPRPLDFVDTICEGIETGLSHAAIAGLCEPPIALGTLEHWIMDSRTQLEAYDAGELEQGSLVSFGQQIAKARSAFEVRKVSKVEAGKGDWVANLAHLTRRDPLSWAERRYEHATVETRSVSITVSLPALAESQILTILKDSITSGSKLLGPPPPAEIEPHGVIDD